MLLEEYLVGADIPATAPFADHLSVETAVSDGEPSHLSAPGGVTGNLPLIQRGVGSLPTVLAAAATFRIWWRADSANRKRSKVEPFRIRRHRSVFQQVFKLNVCHPSTIWCPGGLQGRAIETHSITPVEH